MSVIEVERPRRVTVVEINRSDVRHYVDEELTRSLEEVFDEPARDDVWACVLTGAGDRGADVYGDRLLPSPATGFGVPVKPSRSYEWRTR